MMAWRIERDEDNIPRRMRWIPEARKLAERAKLVRLYLTNVRPLIEPGCRPEEPMPKKARGSSRPPVSEDLLVLMKLNAVAASVLDPLVEELKATSVSISGCRCDAMLWRLESRPGSETRWSDKKRRAFWGMCRLIAKASLEKDSREFSVFASVSGVPGVGEGEPKTRREARKQDVRDSYRFIAARIESLEAGGCAREEAKAIVQHEQDCGRTRIRDSLAWTKAEREDPDSANTDWERRERKRGRGAA